MRKIITILILLTYLAVWIFGAATIGSSITDAPKLLQLIFYIVAGIGWVFPLKPLFAWMNSTETRDED